MNDGGPAFPGSGSSPDHGMSLRDWFAGMALQGILSAHHYADEASQTDVKQCAIFSYEAADAMLAERSKNEPKTKHKS